VRDQPTAAPLLRLAHGAVNHRWRPLCPALSVLQGTIGGWRNRRSHRPRSGSKLATNCSRRKRKPPARWTRSPFSADCGAGGGFVLSGFLRDDADVYRTYSTTARGVDRLMFVQNILDLAPYGRQEDWEDSPPGWPQHPTYG
jgi:hypothetical protein